MEVKAREVVISAIAIESLEKIFEYGTETFNYSSAVAFIEELYNRIERLSTEYLLHPECSYITSTARLYRNIIHGNYLVIYRITNTRVEVLNVFHGSRKPSAIRSSKKIKI